MNKDRRLQKSREIKRDRQLQKKNRERGETDNYI